MMPFLKSPYAENFKGSAVPVRQVLTEIQVRTAAYSFFFFDDSLCWVCFKVAAAPVLYAAVQLWGYSLEQ